MKNKRVWQFIHECVQQQIPVLLLAVIESHGASPGKAGFKMAVAASGERCGTIGGGAMEVTWVNRSLQILAEPDQSAAIRKLFHSRETGHEQSGLICSGSQSILFRPLMQSLRQDIDGIMSMYDQHGAGSLEISSSGFAFSTNSRNAVDYSFQMTSEAEWLYRENLGVLDTVYIVGSGHVGLALSRIMATLDFRVVVLDDRPDAETFVQNSFAHEKICAAYDTVGNHMPGMNREYVAVVTTAYKTDEAALQSILKKNPKYVGLMGSEAKTRQIFDDLRQVGVPEESLLKIHVPIGVPISSHTPEEIAVSVAAEIIKERNESGV